MYNTIEDSKSERKRNIKEWIKSIIVAIMAAIFIQSFLFSINDVSGSSMSPTFEEHERLLLKKYEAFLKTEEYNRGDIVVFDSPLEDDNRFFIKRVIGLPGDIVNIREGQIYIGEQLLDEPYLEKRVYTEPLLYGDYYTVNENELFVVGDNRKPGKSNDSRSFGSISMDRIIGKIIYRIFPLNKANRDF